MTSQRLLGILAPAFLLIGTAQARIGETEAEIRARYGDPIGILSSGGEVSPTKLYLSGGFSIAVTYVNGRSAREMLAKVDQSKITDKELRQLLEANAGGSAWNAQPLDNQKDVPAGLMIWRTDNQSAHVAFYDSRAQAFFVTTQDFVNLTNATNRRNASRVKRGELLAGGSRERLMRNVQKGNAAAMLRDRRPPPSPSPARK